MPITITGTPVFQVLATATSEEDGWENETSAAQCPRGVVLQSRVRQTNTDDLTTCAVSLVYLDGMRVASDGAGGFKLAPL